MTKKPVTGFTLIELIMVILLLSILTAFAIPRFANFGTDGRIVSLQGAYGAIKSASLIAHSHFLINGDDPTILEGSSINMIFGYPAGTVANGIGEAAQITTDDFDLSAAAGVVTVQPIGAIAPISCQFTYTAASSLSSPPAISAPVITGC